MAILFTVLFTALSFPPSSKNRGEILSPLLFLFLAEYSGVGFLSSPLCLKKREDFFVISVDYSAPQ